MWSWRKNSCYSFEKSEEFDIEEKQQNIEMELENLLSELFKSTKNSLDKIQNSLCDRYWKNYWVWEEVNWDEEDWMNCKNFNKVSGYKNPFVAIFDYKKCSIKKADDYGVKRHIDQNVFLKNIKKNKFMISCWLVIWT